MTKYELHIQNWKDCTRCPLHETRTQVVLAKGRIPCDMLFVGEAPGDSEDSTEISGNNGLGSPFIGPAGHLLCGGEQSIVARGVYSILPSVRIAYTNLLACIPKKDGEKSIPSKACLEACKPRLREFVEMCRPQVIVLVGKLAAKTVTGASYFGPIWDFSGTPPLFVEIYHPSGILQSDKIERPLMIKRCIARLQEATRSLVPF